VNSSLFLGADKNFEILQERKAKKMVKVWIADRAINFGQVSSLIAISILLLQGVLEKLSLERNNLDPMR
jgi:hypothetical protein